MGKNNFKALKEKLLAQRRAILAQHLNSVPVAAPMEPATGDAADAASHNDLKEMSLNLKEGEKKTLERIEEALSKIENGTYGHCEECGETIPVKRLLAMPQARYCVGCQEMMEKERR